MEKEQAKKYFRKLMDRIFYNMGNTFEDYYSNGYKSINKSIGIYSVVTPQNFKINLLDKIQGPNADLSDCLDDPSGRCKKNSDHKYLYIGKSVNLRRRIRQYVKHDIKNHRGGYPIWFLENNQDLYIKHITIDEFKEQSLDILYNPATEIYDIVKKNKKTDIAEAIESGLNELHRLAYNNLPFANSDNDKTKVEYKQFWQKYWLDIDITE